MFLERKENQGHKGQITTVIYPVEIVQTMKINGFTKGEGMEKEKNTYSFA